MIDNLEEFFASEIASIYEEKEAVSREHLITGTGADPSTVKCTLQEFNSMEKEINKLKSERAELIRAMEVLLLHVEPAKLNAVALSHAYQVLSKFKVAQP